jgi:signal transduction histidine kinase/ActR/RegA family two-component response regulator
MQRAGSAGLSWQYYATPEEPALDFSVPGTMGQVAATQGRHWVREYWAVMKDRKQIFVPPVHCTREEQLAGLLFPIWMKEQFSGVLVVMLNLQPLIEQYIEPMQSGRYGAGYLLDGDGRVVFDHEAEIIGRNVFDGLHEAYPDLLEMDRKMMEEYSGTGDYHFTVQRNGPVRRKLLAWRHVPIGNRRLIVALSAPDTEVSDILAGYRNQRALSVASLAVALIALGIAFYRRQTRDMARASAREKDLILSSISDAVTYHDHDLRVVWANRAAVRAAGIDSENEFYQQPCYKTFFNRDEICLNCPVRGAMDTGHFCEREMTDPHGCIWMVSAYPARDENGQVVGAVEVKRNITQRKHTEEALRHTEANLRRSQKMEALGRLAGGVAHDFNNLLTSILGYARLIQAELPEDHSARKDLEEIIHNGERAARLTQQLLALGRKRIVALQPVHLNDIVKGMDSLLRRTLGEDIQMTLQLDDRLKSIRADVGLIEQVVLNLAINARNAMPQGGALHIETRRLTLDAAEALRHDGMKPGRYALMIIRDTGCGMRPEVMEHAFEPFYTTAREGQGTGLGLSTVYGIIQQCEGDIELDSQPDKGTEFRLYFPHIEEAVSREKRHEGTSLPQGHETVLVVEDEDAVRLLAVRILEAQGYHVLEAKDGEEALKLADEYPGTIDLVFTDVVMPRIGGPEMVEHLKQQRNIAVLYTTGFTQHTIIQHGLAAHEVNMLPKPYSREQLARQIRSLLDQRSV